MSCRRIAAIVILAAALRLSPLSYAQELGATNSADRPPSDLRDAVRAELAPDGIEVKIGPETATFWWVRRLPLTSAAPGWAGVAEGALIGAVRFGAASRDIRGRTIKPGVYTLRLGIQPANGDHLGVSPHREFLLVSPSAADTTAAPLGHDATIALSKATVGISHPAVLSIDPPSATEQPLQVHTTEAGHKALVFEVQTTADGKDTGPLRFGLVLIGRIEA